MSAVVNLEFDLGETWNVDAVCTDSLGNTINVSAAQAIQWRAVNQAGDTILDLAKNSGITLINGGVNGEILIAVTPAMQSALVASWCKHQCRVTLSDGTITDQFAGSLKINPSLF